MNLLESIKIGSIVGKYLGGKESKEELALLRIWLGRASKNQEIFNKLKEEKNIGEAIEAYETYNKELAWERYRQRVTALTFRNVLFRWKVAAVFFFLVGCAGILSYINNEWLTPSTSDNTFTTISTNNGQNSKIILPDSSVVWISSGTTLSYNTNFSVKNRLIKLSGQAFFQVARNEEIPLIVTCNELKVKVLGTKFDVSAYPEDRNVSVILESGSIELLKVHDQSFKLKLNPGEVAEFDVERKELLVSKEGSYKFTSWKDGILILKNDPMSEVFKKLERWYNIDIDVKNDKVNQLIFNATIVNENVEEIFDLIKFSCGINYEIIPSDDPEIPVKVILTK